MVRCRGTTKKDDPCDFELPDDSEFCSKCGTLVEKEEEDKTVYLVCEGTDKKGQSCGNRLQDGINFCPKCGTEILRDIESPSSGSLESSVYKNKFTSDAAETIDSKSDAEGDNVMQRKTLIDSRICQQDKDTITALVKENEGAKIQKGNLIFIPMSQIEKKEVKDDAKIQGLDYNSNANTSSLSQVGNLKLFPTSMSQENKTVSQPSTKVESLDHSNSHTGDSKHNTETPSQGNFNIYPNMEDQMGSGRSSSDVVDREKMDQTVEEGTKTHEKTVDNGQQAAVVIDPPLKSCVVEGYKNLFDNPPLPSNLPAFVGKQHSSQAEVKPGEKCQFEDTNHDSDTSESGSDESDSEGEKDVCQNEQKINETNDNKPSTGKKSNNKRKRSKQKKKFGDKILQSNTQTDPAINLNSGPLPGMAVISTTEGVEKQGVSTRSQTYASVTKNSTRLVEGLNKNVSSSSKEADANKHDCKTDNGDVEKESTKTRNSSKNKKTNDNKEKQNVCGETSEQENVKQNVKQTKNKNEQDKKGDTKAISNENKQAGSKYSTVQTRMRKDHFEVHFHILVSPSTDFNPKKQDVIIRGIGGWEKDINNVMSVTGCLKEEYIELEAVKMIPKQMFSHGVCVEYKYVIRTRKTDYHAWEDYSRKYDYRYNNRRLYIYPNTEGVHHQYDAVLMLKEEKSIFSKISKFIGFADKVIDVRMKEADLYLHLYLPQLIQKLAEVSVGDVAEDILEQIHCLIRGWRTVYIKDAQLWSLEQYREKMMVYICIWTALLKKMADDESGNQDNLDYEQSSRKVVLAVSLIHLGQIMEYNFDENTTAILLGGLILQPDTKTKICHEYASLKHHFSRTLKNVESSLLTFCKNVAFKSRDPSWLFGMPLIHFLHESSVPYEDLEPNIKHGDKDAKWWGIEQLKQDVDYFKTKTTPWKIPLAQIMIRLPPLFEVDKLLPRTLMAALKLEEVEVVATCSGIGTDVIAATLTFYMKAYLKTNLMEKCLRILKSKVEESIRGSYNDLMKKRDMVYMTLRISFHLLMAAFRLTSYTINEGICILTMHIFLTTASDLMQINDEKEETKKQKDWVKKKVTEVCRMACERFYRSSLRIEELLKVWSSLLTVNMIDGIVKDAWTEYLVDHLGKKLEDTVKYGYSLKELVSVYCQKFDQFSPSVQEVLSKTVFLTIEKGFDDNFDVSSMGPDEKRRYGDLLSKFFENHWKKYLHESGYGSNEDSIFYLILTWNPLQNFLKMFYGADERRHTVLTNECKEQLAQALSFLENTAMKVRTGDVQIKTLNDIFKHSHSFISIMKIVEDTSKDGKMVPFSVILEDRKKELDFFHRKKKKIGKFLDMCHRIGEKVDTNELLNIVQHFEEIDKCCLNDLCTPRNSYENKEEDEYRPVITCFSETGADSDDDLLDPLETCSQSTVFIKMWEDMGKRVRQSKNNLLVKDVIHSVWIPVRQEWKSFCERVQVGAVLFREMDKFFGNYKKDEEFLRFELQLMCNSEDTKWIDERIKQLQQHGLVETCAQGASVIMEVVDAYQLQGNFTEVKKITSFIGGKDMSMKEFDASFLKTCKFLQHLTEPRSKALFHFVQSKNLVTWLRESMDGLKELKVFVELASISAGEEPLDIARVNCLHNATTGYAPLIFDLDTNCDIQRLLEKCEILWKELDANPKLPDKLRDTARQLEWLKTVKQAHGSVEVTSLFQAEAINSKGIYQVGNLWGPERPKHIVELNDVLKLSVAEYKQQGKDDDQQMKMEKKTYHFLQLQDLQSRLMLVAGKTQRAKDVDRFTMVYDGITRLARVYTKLLSSGCVLFENWQAKFLCDPARPVCVFIEFGQGNQRQTLKGRHDDEDLSLIISRLAKFMEDCLQAWLDYIDKKRNEYFHLNFFTINQLVILQKELVKVGTEEEPLNLMYPLLSFVKFGCATDDIITAMIAAKEDVEDKMKIETENFDEEIEVEEAEPKIDDQIKTFVEQIVLTGFSEDLARAALNFVQPDKVDEGIVWCLDHDTEDIEKETFDFYGGLPTEEPKERETISFKGWTQTDESISSVTASILRKLPESNREVSVNPLLQGLEKLWQEFLCSISSSMADYLSVEHLGLILRRLAQRERRTVARKFPQCFREGEPNLIICPQVDILNTVMSLYAFDDSQSLPEPDEVLVCTQDTTIDQLDIFWRRAVSADNQEGKIHCLVKGDLLDYDVSDQGERRLEKYRQLSTGHNFHLVVLCSTENEYRSRLVASLDKFRRPPITLSSLQNIKKYLIKKLRVEDSSPTFKPASFTDFDKSSVRVVKSCRAGVGKTLYKKRMAEELHKLNPKLVKRYQDEITIPLQGKNIDITMVMAILLKETLSPKHREPRLFHIDISFEVQENVDFFLFNLLILRCLMDKHGYVWWRSPDDIYMIETMPALWKDQTQKNILRCTHPILDILPDLMCRSPQESLDIMLNRARPEGYQPHDRLFDEIEFRSSVFQRPFQYLSRLDQGKGLNDIDPFTPEGKMEECLIVLLRHCGIQHDPSWAELRHFVYFLNTQLRDFERSDFCGAAAAEDLPGYAQFVLRFLMTMSRDFATRSLVMSEESPEIHGDKKMKEDDTDDIEQYQLRRTWESSPHPYLFFNPDRHSMTFLGFNIERKTGDLVDSQSGNVLQRNIMPQPLMQGLHRNNVPITENFDVLPRHEKILKLCRVMGNELAHDPDETYELTTDNVKKIMAIYMRFRCSIPVIIMGETGCGKTRLVKFMCELQCPPGADVQSMILLKVHGGTTNNDIIRKVEKAQEIAEKNSKQFGDSFYTVLFFDEANTTESIGLIKEIMCDGSIAGKRLSISSSLKIVAACNPYRKHSDTLIKTLEQAGLGYHVDADKTTDRLGRVPMRHLVYRVQPLPQSMLPLVWDFGQLNTAVEELYIKQMVLRYVRNGELPNIDGFVNVVSKILTVSQDFMRAQKDECSFVSLRDVERVLNVMSWFYEQREGDESLFNHIDTNLGDGDQFDTDDENEEEEEIIADEEMTEEEAVSRALVLSLGVCYHACLKKRDEYRDCVTKYFQPPCRRFSSDEIYEEINSCQEVFLKNVQLGPNIARNQALKENVFMMVICIEMRIPLFLVGKPGSSKSLAKTIVADAMQGNAAYGELFRQFKQVQMVSFQCSPLSTPDGILGTFRHCAQFQKDKDMDRFVSVVVLDEVGLAEDSPKMPLKTLHPLLEDGCQGDEKPEPHMKVAFIGISNWALDPAKMNRGILVQREVPDMEELQESAEGICSEDKRVKDCIKTMLKPMARSYLDLFEEALQLREFFGLRDFYSLVKMVYAFANDSRRTPTWHQLKHAILRNFGGLEMVNPVDAFAKNLGVHKPDKPEPGDPDCSPTGLIKASLTADGTSESRYLLLLTENYGALSILQQQIHNLHNAITIFGSSFPSDQEYTQVCRNINRIKVCMETGNTVVLLNLENLYESLYDALNQYYVRFGGDRYVDLGLGTHRVKCRVHDNFRLIVVAEKKVVYDKFPIPLINRLEKHFLTVTTMLDPEQIQMVHDLEKWAEDFTTLTTRVPIRGQKKKVMMGESFMGYHADTCAAAILHASEVVRKSGQTENIQVFEFAKQVLLWCATPDAVMRVLKTRLLADSDMLTKIYFKEQHHESLLEYLQYQIKSMHPHSLYAQVTTHSKLLSDKDTTVVSEELGISKQKIFLLTLQSFDTEQQFCRQVKKFIENSKGAESLLIVQCDSGNENSSLIACARYCVQDEFHQEVEHMCTPAHVVFVVQVPRIAGGCFTGFQCGKWHSVHIDDVLPQDDTLPNIMDMKGQSVGELMEMALHGTGTRNIEESMDEDDSDMFHNNLLEDADMGDITVEMAEFEHSVHPRNKHLNVAKLVHACIQSASATVKDTDDTQRSTDRIKIILELLSHCQNGDKCSFLSGLACHLAAILKEKDQTKSLYIDLQDHWLTVEATEASCINKAGTFRRAWIQCLESKVSPVLAGIISFVDTNRNLDLLLHCAPGSWEVAFWLQVFNTPEATQLQNIEFVSPKKEAELAEIYVKTMGHEGQSYAVRMPFSWLIFKLINTVVKTVTSSNIQYHGGDVITDAARVFQETLPMGQILQQLTSGEVQLDMIKAYLADFVHMTHRCHSTTEHELVCESLFNAVQQKLQKMDIARSLLQTFIAIHNVFDSIKDRLKNFSDVVQVWPKCTVTIQELQESGQNHYLFSEEEFTLDVIGLTLMLEHLQPLDQKELNEIGQRNSWLKRVQCYRPLVERMLGSVSMDCHDVEVGIYGRRCRRAVHDNRKLWIRIVVVKLFIEHVCKAHTKEEGDKYTSQRCSVLWHMLKDYSDLKQLTGLEKVEKFLQLINKEALKKYLEEQEKCPHCDSTMESPPVVLPCKDKICVQCFNDLKVIGGQECPKCKSSVPHDFDPEKDGSKNKNIADFKNFRRRCNSFFMDVVAQLCFADNLPPEDKVIDRLLGYITMEMKDKQIMKSKELTIFSTCLDPTPVFRLFLLQLLLSKSGEQVETNFKRYFDQATRLIQGAEHEKENHLTDLSLLIIQCLEDSYYQESRMNGLKDTEEMQFATDLLQAAKSDLTANELTVEKLTCLAEARFGLSLAAKFMDAVFVKKSRKFSPEIRRLLNAAASLCEECGTQWPKIFFAKQLCRVFGMASYQEICQKRTDHNFLQWVLLEDAEQKVKDCADRYIVYGDVYRQLREAVTRVAIGEDITQLTTAFKDSTAEQHEKEMLLCLAVHREITLSLIHPENKRKVTVKNFEEMEKLVEEGHLSVDQVILDSLLKNSIGHHCYHLNVVLDMDLRHQSIACLLFHCLVTLTFAAGQNSLIEPLERLALQPESMRNAFLPTMPQDDLEEIKVAILASRNMQGADDNPVFYRCPNGHPYVIGNCGRPATIGRCNVCQSHIGGQNYNLQDRNKQDEGVDQTAIGHILGCAKQRSGTAVPERDLGRTTCAIVRLFVHMTMYCGTNNNPQAVQSMIHPDVDMENVSTFLWDHILVDLQILQDAMNKSLDDVILLMHLMIKNLHKDGLPGVVRDPNMSMLTTKDLRRKWENVFAKKWINPILESLDTVLQDTEKQIVKDNRMGADPLLCLMYEIDVPQERIPPTMLHDLPAVWRYRSRITLDDLKNKFETGRGAAHHLILELFLNEDNYLQALRFVPSIIKLQSMLIKRYQRKLDRAEAASMTIKDFLERASDEGMMQECGELVNDFITAWNCCREALQNYPCVTAQGAKKVAKEYCLHEMDRSCPLGMLIPTLRDTGLCSYVLLHFLLTQQNEFLQKFCKIKFPRKKITDVVVAVDVSSITPAHLISYHPDQDILPMILANCNYQFEVGKGTKVEYDFGNIERQLIDRFIFSRPTITIGQLETMVYRASSTNAEVFANLDRKIKQESLTMAVKNQICRDFRSLPDICTCLHQIDIAISFLISIGGTGEESLQHFMLETLKMEQALTSQKARQICQFCNVRSLWFLLSMEKSKRLSQHGKNAFEEIDEDYHHPLPENSEEALEQCLQPLSLDKTEVLLELIFECIMLHITKPQNMDDEDYVDTGKQSLSDTILGYIDILEDDHSKWWMPLYPNFPKEILGEHSTATWEFVFQMLLKKQRESP